ncbi:MAG: 2-C-methyl-D-erythritol 4-phosphate cytidylyltransferase [Nitrospirota bacterium]
MNKCSGKSIMKEEVVAIVPAAGLGKRFGPGQRKPFITILDKPLLLWVIESLETSEDIDEVIPVLREQDMDYGVELVKKYGLTKIRRIAKGGSERQVSVFNGLKLVPDHTSVILIHDGVRPFLEKSLIKELLKHLSGNDGVISAVPLKDTIKEIDSNGLVRTTPKRESFWAVQTPQVFYYRKLFDSYENAFKEGFYSTDDSALVERYGGKVRIVMGSYKNIKITTPEDIILAELFLKLRLNPNNADIVQKFI